MVKLFSEDKDEIRKTFKPECRIFVLVDEEDAPWQKKKKKGKRSQGHFLKVEDLKVFTEGESKLNN